METQQKPQEDATPMSDMRLTQIGESIELDGDMLDACSMPDGWEEDMARDGHEQRLELHAEVLRQRARIVQLEAMLSAARDAHHHDLDRVWVALGNEHEPPTDVDAVVESAEMERAFAAGRLKKIAALESIARVPVSDLARLFALVDESRARNHSEAWEILLRLAAERGATEDDLRKALRGEGSVR